MDPYQLIQQNNAWSAQQAQKQMDFQERMSNTAHVREIQDLKNAGLNPVLSAKLGGASTPSGAMGDTDTQGTAELIRMAMQGMSIAGSASRAAENITSMQNGNLPAGVEVEKTSGKDVGTGRRYGIGEISNKGKAFISGVGALIGTALGGPKLGATLGALGLGWANDHNKKVKAGDVDAVTSASFTNFQNAIDQSTAGTLNVPGLIQKKKRSYSHRSGKF